MCFTLALIGLPDRLNRQSFDLAWTQMYPQCKEHQPSAPGVYVRAQCFFTVATELADNLRGRGHTVTVMEKG